MKSSNIDTSLSPDELLTYALFLGCTSFELTHYRIFIFTFFELHFALVLIYRILKGNRVNQFSVEAFLALTKLVIL